MKVPLKSYCGGGIDTDQIIHIMTLLYKYYNTEDGYPEKEDRHAPY